MWVEVNMQMYCALAHHDGRYSVVRLNPRNGWGTIVSQHRYASRAEAERIACALSGYNPVCRSGSGTKGIFRYREALHKWRAQHPKEMGQVMTARVRTNMAEELEDETEVV